MEQIFGISLLSILYLSLVINFLTVSGCVILYLLYREFRRLALISKVGIDNANGFQRKTQPFFEKRKKRAEGKSFKIPFVNDKRKEDRRASERRASEKVDKRRYGRRENDAKEDRGRVTVVMLDIDDFKLINTLLTYFVADEVLVALAKALRENVRTTDFLGHIHGDEFAIVFCDISVETVTQILERAKEQFATSVKHKRLKGRKVSFTAGISSTVDDSVGYDELRSIANADLIVKKENK